MRHCVDKPLAPWYNSRKMVALGKDSTTMNTRRLFSVLLLSGGIAAFLLRLMQVRTGFEAATGLPVPGNPYARLLLLLWAVLAVAFFLLCRRLPGQTDSPFTFADGFATTCPKLLSLPVAGIFLLGLSGALEILGGVGLPVGTGGLPARVLLLQGGLSLLSAACLFPAAASCRRAPAVEDAANPRRNIRNDLLLVPVVCLVVRLVLAYRAYSIDPALAGYYVELLALVFLTLGFYRLSAFAFRAGRTRRFTLYTLSAVTLCIATMADGHGPALSLLYAGGALTLLGFLLLRLEVLSAAQAEG